MGASYGTYGTTDENQRLTGDDDLENGQNSNGWSLKGMGFSGNRNKVITVGTLILATAAVAVVATAVVTHNSTENVETGGKAEAMHPFSGRGYADTDTHRADHPWDRD